MKKVLLSIRPEYANKIFSGEKLYEFRKTIFVDLRVKVAVVYATRPISKVIGQFDIENVIQGTPQQIWSVTKRSAGVSKEFFDKYFDGKSCAYAIKVNNPTTYDRPQTLQEVINRSTPPQSFCYIR
ncbi:hypothetical protein [Zooshikella sp. RANM57]|uniref:hypothetical protein n=1 Tax=Zooshikella sp. RANM57 TaxID=3425863 RepID=UPI003D700971